MRILRREQPLFLTVASQAPTPSFALRRGGERGCGGGAETAGKRGRSIFNPADWWAGRESRSGEEKIAARGVMSVSNREWALRFAVRALTKSGIGGNVFTTAQYASEVHAEFGVPLDDAMEGAENHLADAGCTKIGDGVWKIP